MLPESAMFPLRSGYRAGSEIGEDEMARIRKEDHATILMRVDVEQRAVREIAAEYGCTPAAIYALLKKLRAASSPATEPAEIQAPLALDPAPRSEPLLQDEPKVVTLEPATRAPAPPAVRLPPRLELAVRSESSAKLGAKLAKPGIGLAMRTADGEETMTPFRSVDDLLSAIKPILRASARGPEPVWFSLQPIDLSAIDVEAA